jgi:membrane protease YdiL (CAAX protease family)
VKAGRFRLHDHPWLALPVFLLSLVVCFALAGALVPGVLGLRPGSMAANTAIPLLANCLCLFVLAPFVLRLPAGSRSLGAYLRDIRLPGTGRSWLRLALLGLSCWVLLAASQALGSVAARAAAGGAVDGRFLASVFDLSRELPPRSWSVVRSLPSLLEEVAFRGVLLALFLRRWSRTGAIAVSALAFGAIHLLNLPNREPIWVLGQVGWASLLGIAYAYTVVKTESLVPAMILHYLGNLFVGTFNGYVWTSTTTGTQVIIGLLFTFGLVPSAVIILWTRFFSARWLARPGAQVPAQVSR